MPKQQATPALRTARHEITIAAPAERVYPLLAEVEHWPRVFPPTVHVEVLERGGGHERLRIWATANGEVKTWTSARTLDAGARRIDFAQEVSQPPVARMGGRWTVVEAGPGETRVHLDHHYAAVGDDPEGLAWIAQAVDRNSQAELASLRATAEQGGVTGESTFSFEDSVELAGPTGMAYDFVCRAELWQERLPHVARVELTEDVPDLQTLEMDTRTRDGQLHTTRSIRVCFPRERIVYKQLVLPALLKVHNGLWTFVDDAGGGRMTSRHTVTVDPDAVEQIVGKGATVADAGEFVRNALSANSRATLELARTFAREAS